MVWDEEVLQRQKLLLTRELQQSTAPGSQIFLICSSIGTTNLSASGYFVVYPIGLTTGVV